MKVEELVELSLESTDGRLKLLWSIHEGDRVTRQRVEILIQRHHEMMGKKSQLSMSRNPPFRPTESPANLDQ